MGDGALLYRCVITSKGTTDASEPGASLLPILSIAIFSVVEDVRGTMEPRPTPIIVPKYTNFTVYMNDPNNPTRRIVALARHTRCTNPRALWKVSDTKNILVTGEWVVPWFFFSFY